MKKYCVTFTQSIGVNESFVTVAQDLKFEDAVQFALNLHRSCNCPHLICVRLGGFKDKIDVPSVEFFSED